MLPNLHMKERWDKYYVGKKRDQVEVIPQEPIIESICSLVNVEHKRVLEVGSGRAADSIYLAKLGANVVAFDYSEIAIKMVKETSSSKGVSLCMVVGDASDLPFKDKSFDIVFHQGFLEHFKYPASLLKEQYIVLKPEGLLLVDVPQKWHIYTILKHLLIKLGLWAPGWESQYSYRELGKLLRDQKLKIVYSYGWGSLLLWILKYYKLIGSKSKNPKLKNEFLWKLKKIWWKSPFALYRMFQR